MAFEDVEDLAQQLGSEPAHSADVDHGDAFLGGDGLQHTFFAGMRHDLSSLPLWITRVHNPDGNVFAHGGNEGGRVQHFGTEIGQVRGFFKAHAGDPTSFGTHLWIGAQDTVDVGPNLDARGVERCAHNGGSEIGATAAEGGGNTVAGSADESAE